MRKIRNAAECLQRKSMGMLTAVLWVLSLAVCGCGEGQESGDVSKEKAEADSLADVMFDCLDANRFADCLEAGTKAFRLYEALSDSNGMGETSFTMGTAYQRLGDYSSAMLMVERALSIDSVSGDAELMSTDYNSLAAIYLADNQEDKAEQFILKAIGYEKQTATMSRLSVRYGIAAEIYAKKGDGATALDYAQKGYALAEAAKDTVQMGKRMSQMGDAYRALDRFDEAILAYGKANELLTACDNELSLCINEKQIGVVMLKQGRQAEALAHYERALAISRRVGYALIELQSMQAIADLCRESNPQRSCRLYAMSGKLSDSIHTAQLADLTTSYAARFETAEKLQTIEEQARTIRMHRYLLAAYTAFFVIVLSLAGLYIYNVRLRRKHEQLEARFSENVVKQTQHDEPAMSEADQQFLDQLAREVENRMGDCALSSATLADAFCVSQRQFARKVKTLTGIDTTHYIRASRILKARKLLETTDLSMAEIYVQCGFESANYFSRVFKQDVGMTPTEYRKNTAKSVD